MRGRTDDPSPLFHVFNVEDRIRPDHPLRDIKRRVDRLLAGMSAAFEKAYSTTGRPSGPERAAAVRADRHRPAVPLVPRPTAGRRRVRPGHLPPQRKRLDTHGLTAAFFASVVGEAVTARLCSDHFTIDGTLIESWAALKSFQPADGGGTGPADGNGFQPRNPDVDFRGQRRTIDTHRSRTDPEAWLYRKGLG